MTYGELDQRARAIAACLQTAASRASASCLRTRPARIHRGILRVLYAGCVAVPAYPPRRRTLDRFDAIARDAGARTALSTASSIAQFKAMPGASLRSGGSPPTSSHAPTPTTGRARAIARLPRDDPVHLGLHQPAKGVMLSHATSSQHPPISNAFAIQSDSRASSGSLPTTTWDSSAASRAVFSAFQHHHGAAKFLQNPFLWLDAIGKSRATISGGPNFATTVRPQDGADSARRSTLLWSVAFSGSEAVRPEISRASRGLCAVCFRPESFYPCYGLAEATLMSPARFRTGAACTRSATMPWRKPRRAAAAMPRTRAASPGAARHRLARRFHRRRKTLAPVAPDRVGEIWSPAIRRPGYWRDRNGLRRVPRTPAVPQAKALSAYPATSASSTTASSTSPAGRRPHRRPRPQPPPAGHRSHRRALPPLARSRSRRAFAVDDDGTQRSSWCTSRAHGSSDLAPALTRPCARPRRARPRARRRRADPCGTIAKTSSGKVRATPAAPHSLPAAQTSRPEPQASHATSAVLPRNPPRSPPSVSTHSRCRVPVLADVTPETSIDALAWIAAARRARRRARPEFRPHLPTPSTARHDPRDLANAVQKHLIDHPQTDAPKGTSPRRTTPSRCSRIPRAQAPPAHGGGRRRGQPLLQSTTAPTRRPRRRRPRPHATAAC